MKSRTYKRKIRTLTHWKIEMKNLSQIEHHQYKHTHVRMYLSFLEVLHLSYFRPIPSLHVSNYEMKFSLFCHNMYSINFHVHPSITFENFMNNLLCIHFRLFWYCIASCHKCHVILFRIISYYDMSYSIK